MSGDQAGPAVHQQSAWIPNIRAQLRAARRAHSFVYRQSRVLREDQAQVCGSHHDMHASISVETMASRCVIVLHHMYTYLQPARPEGQLCWGLRNGPITKSFLSQEPPSALVQTAAMEPLWGVHGTRCHSQELHGCEQKTRRDGTSNSSAHHAQAPLPAVGH